MKSPKDKRFSLHGTNSFLNLLGDVFTARNYVRFPSEIARGVTESPVSHLQSMFINL